MSNFKSINTTTGIRWRNKQRDWDWCGVASLRANTHTHKPGVWWCCEKKKEEALVKKSEQLRWVDTCVWSLSNDLKHKLKLKKKFLLFYYTHIYAKQIDETWLAIRKLRCFSNRQQVALVFYLLLSSCAIHTYVRTCKVYAFGLKFSRFCSLPAFPKC